MKLLKVVYDEEQDAFKIMFTIDGEEWLEDCSFPCNAREGGNGDKNFIHFGIVNKINEICGQGYKLIVDKSNER